MEEAPRLVKAAVKQVMVAQLMNRRSSLRMAYICTPCVDEANSIGKELRILDWALSGAEKRKDEERG